MQIQQARILLADDHDVVRAGIRAILQQHEEWIVCGEARNGQEAIALAEQTAPDIIVLDVELGDVDGVAVTRRIKKARPDAEVLVFTMHDDDYLIRNILSAGARAFVLKSEGTQTLVRAIECAIQHKPFFADRASETLLHSFRSSADAPKTSPLTDRERQIVTLLATGKSNKEAAQMLGISVKTVETHRAAIMRKLGFRSIVKLVRYAVRERLIEP